MLHNFRESSQLMELGPVCVYVYVVLRKRSYRLCESDCGAIPCNVRARLHSFVGTIEIRRDLFRDLTRFYRVPKHLVARVGHSSSLISRVRRNVFNALSLCPLDLSISLPRLLRYRAEYVLLCKTGIDTVNVYFANIRPRIARIVRARSSPSRNR